jgi:integrase
LDPNGLSGTAVQPRAARRRPEPRQTPSFAQVRLRAAVIAIALTLPKGKPKSFYGKTQAEALEKKRNALRDQDNGIDLGQKKLRVGEFLDRWLEDVAGPKVRPKTYRFYEQVVRVHLKPGLGRHDLAKLTPVHVQRFLNEKKAAGLSPQTCGHLRAVLRTALNQAVRWYLVPRNAAALASPPRIERVPVQPLTAAQARAFLAQAKDDRLVGLFRLAILTGMRQGELFALRWADVDLDAGVLHVRHALHRSKGEWTLAEPKSRASRRTVTLPASAVTELRAHRDRQAFERSAAGERWQDHDFVFCSTVGTPLDASNVNARLRKLLEDAHLPRQRFYDLRHLAASLMLEGRVDLKTISDVLGHSQIGITANLYAHLAPSLRREAANALEAVLDAAS